MRQALIVKNYKTRIRVRIVNYYITKIQAPPANYYKTNSTAQIANSIKIKHRAWRTKCKLKTKVMIRRTIMRRSLRRMWSLPKPKKWKR